MPYDKSSQRMSNTLGLRRQLMKRAKDQALIQPLLDLIKKFPRKYADGFYTLMSESQVDKKEIEVILGRLFKEPIRVIYVGLHDLRMDEEEQQRVHDLIADSTIDRFLPCVESAGSEDEDLLRAVKVSLGTHKISEALDQPFGHDFSQMVKDIVTAFWNCHCRAVLRADAADIEKYGEVCRILTKVMPIGATYVENTAHVRVFVERTMALEAAVSPTLLLTSAEETAKRMLAREPSFARALLGALQAEIVGAENLKD